MADATRNTSGSANDTADRAEQIGSTLAWIFVSALLALFAYGFVPNFI